MRAHDRSSRTTAPNEQTEAARRAPGDPHRLLALQRSIGNEAVAALLRAEEEHADGEGRGHDASVQLAMIERGLRSPGRPLGEATLARKENQFQANFSGVRMHDGPEAAAAAAAVEARAFTVDQDIVLGERGDDPEVLDHELTHVVRNQQRATAGHDTGGGFTMTHPRDGVEQEATSNAARMRSGGPSAVVGGAPNVARAPASPAPIQRWAFVNGQQVGADTANLTPKMKELAADELVHDYVSDAEFQDHAEGRTDYLGNLPGPASQGTWVRFSPDGINVIGEQHTAVTLRDVLAAVGSSSFVYEPFVTESLDEEKNTQAAYREELSTTLGRFGMAEGSDWTSRGAESMYPKMGHAMAQLLPYLQDPATLTMLGESGEHRHLGQQLQRYLKIAWQYGKDMREQQNEKPARTGLVDVYTRIKHPRSGMSRLLHALDTNVNDFIKDLPHGGYLGDALVNREYVEPLADYVKALVDELRERGADDPIAPTGRPANVPAGVPLTAAEKETELGNRRDAHFQAAVANALRRGIRYAGMGMDHFRTLTPGPGWHLYDMRSQHLVRFEDLTRQRRQQAQGGQ